jgi:hypothetical protein
MKKVWRWLAVLALLLLVGLIVAAFLEPSGTVRAYIAGEPFYHGRPLRHWREVLREQGQQGHVSREVRGQFWESEAALPVLLACARDPDVKVRWPAVALVGYYGRGQQEPFAVLIGALQDEEADVRLQAVRRLGSWGPLARQAVPDLIVALRDSNLEVAHTADLALWEIDVPAALRASGWKLYRSRRWGFSVVLPGKPEESQREAALAPVTVHTFEAWHMVGHEKGPIRYVVSVCDYPEEVVRDSTEKERLEASATWAAFGLNGKVGSKREVKQGGRKGQEHTIEVQGTGVVRTRLFWSGRRLYFALVSYVPRFLNAKAVDYFLDSLRLEEPERHQAEILPPPREE